MSHDLRIERVIDATPDEVFAAFTEAEAIAEWWEAFDGWSVEVVACDARLGGTTSVVFGTAGSVPYREDMTYTIFERPHRVACTDIFANPDGTTVQTALDVTFDAHEGKTLMTLVQTGFPTATQRDRHQGGWPRFLDRLESVVGGRSRA